MGSTLNIYYYSTQMDREYLEAQLISFLGEEVWSNLMSRMEDSMNPSGSSWFFLNRQYLEMQLVSMLGGEMWSQLMSRVENTMTKPQSYWFLFNLLSRWLSAYKLGKSIVHQNNKQEENEDKEKVEANNDAEQNDGDSDSAVSMDETDLDSENNFEIHDDLHSKNFEVSNTEVLNVNEVEVVNGECNQNYMNDIIMEEAEIEDENDNEDNYETCLDNNAADKINGECFKEDVDKTINKIMLKEEMVSMSDLEEVSDDIPSKELEIPELKVNAEHSDNDMDDNKELMEDRKEISNEALQENHLEENHFNISDSKQNIDSFDEINHDPYDSTETKEIVKSVNEINLEENETPFVESHESHIEDNNSGIFYSKQNSDTESDFENKIVLDAKQIDSSKELQISENKTSLDNYATQSEIVEECTLEENNNEMYNSKQNAITDIDMIYDLDIKEMDNDVPSSTLEVTGFEQCSEVSINDDIQDDSNNHLIDSEYVIKDCNEVQIKNEDNTFDEEQPPKDDYSMQNKQFENVECSKTINVENDFDMDDKVSINEFEDYHINTKSMDTDVSTSTNLCDQFEEIYENNYL